MTHGLLHHLLLTLRLNFRSKQALIYGYVVPIFFLIAFGSVFNKTIPPLSREMGQLLVVTVLGGACFGMPTAMVSERERGVWRRYRLLPAGTGGVVISTMVARFVIVLSAAVMQIFLAHWIYKTPFPVHPWALAGVFCFVTFAFLGMGLVIAMAADNVPAVQALGQAIFLPLIMIGGVGVKLESLPKFCQQIAGYLPGRYAVDALDACIQTKAPYHAMPIRFCLAALVVIGVAGCVAGRQMFRWDAATKMAAGARAWVGVAIAAWLAVGLTAQSTGRLKTTDNLPVAAGARPESIPPIGPIAASQPVIATTNEAVATTWPATRSLTAQLAPWTAITEEDIAKITYDDLDSDNGTVTPVAQNLDNLDEDGRKWMERFNDRLDNWGPGKVPDTVQRVRNLLSVAAVADILQDQFEAEIPHEVFAHLKYDLPPDKLKQVLAYIALNPDEGNVIATMPELGIEGEVGREEEIHVRVCAYARKLLARLLGKVP